MRSRTVPAVILWGLTCLAALAAPSVAEAQVRVRDLVITLAGSVEDYTGNLSAVTVPVVDSADHARSVAGEVAIRGLISFLESPTRALQLSVDGGMRQATAMGFAFRDYAPREWVGTGELTFTQTVGSWVSLRASSRVQGRSVRDRTPMPLFLQPGYVIGSGSFGLATRTFQGVSFDASAQLERGDYLAAKYLPQLDLLDRRGKGLEVGARWGSAPSSLRAFGGLWWTEYRHQPSFVADDPFRRDRTVRAGVDWSYFGSTIVQVGVEGALNRSNSNRPEYDALALRTAVTVPLPSSMTLNAYAVLTVKGYLHETDYAVLVPGEEADNASVAYLQLVRPIADDLDGAVRLAWTRAETDIGAQYYRRVGLSVEFNYRPLWY